MKKRILALALSLVFVLTLFPAYTFAEDDVVQEEDIVTVEEQTQEISDVISTEETTDDESAETYEAVEEIVEEAPELMGAAEVQSAEEVVASEEAPVLEPASQACKIGKKIYGSIEEALAAAHEDEGEKNPTVITMIADDEENVTIPEKRYITLDLNGYVVKGTGSGAVITTIGNLTIKDSRTTDKPKHYFTEATDGTMFWTWNGDNDETNYYVEGGVITGGKPVTKDGDGAGIFCNGGSLNVVGVNIVGNQGTYGGGIRFGDVTCTSNISNCVVSHNKTDKVTTWTNTGGICYGQGSGPHYLTETTVSYNYTCAVTVGNANGGGVTVHGATVTITECTIKGNVASGNAGGVVVKGSASATIIGGEISGNICGSGFNGGGVYLESGSLTLGGDVKITGNKKGSGTSAVANNLYLVSGKVVTVSTTTPLTTDASIGVTTAATSGTVNVTGKNSNNYSTYFTSDNTDYSIINNGSDNNQVVQLVAHQHSWSYTLSEDKKTITASCSGKGTCDYTGSDKSLTIQAPAAASLVYDGSAHNATFGTATTFLGSSLPTISYQYKADETGEYAQATDTKKAGFYKASFTVGEGTGAKTAYVEYEVTKRQLAVSGTQVNNKTYDAGTAATATAGTVTGIVTGDDAKVAVDSATFADKNAGPGKSVTVTYKVTGDDAGNYIAPANDLASADISPRQLTVTGSTADVKDYDGTTAAVSHIGEVNGIVDSDDVTVTIASAVFDNKNAGNGKTVTIVYAMSGEDIGNYNVPLSDTTTTDIEKKQLNVKADDKTSYVGSELEKLTYTADELISGDSFTGELSTNADKNVIGTYDIIQNTLSVSDGNEGKNYTINYTKGTYTVTAKEIQTLTFEGVTGGKVTKTYGDKAFTEIVTGAETAVTYSSSDPSVATVDEKTGKVNILKVGKTIITANAAESYKYAPGSAQYELTVGTKQLTVSGTTVSDKYYDGNKTASVTCGTPDGIIYGDTVTVSAAAEFESESVGKHSVTVTYSISGADAGNYTAPNAEVKEAEIKANTITGVTLNGYSGTYDGQNHSVTLAGTVAGDSVRYSTDGETFALTEAPEYKLASTYTVYVKVSRVGSNDFTANATVEIKKAALTVTGTTADSKTYDGTTTAVAHIGTVGGICSGDEGKVTVAVQSAAFDNRNAGNGKTVTVIYSISGSEADNYIAPANYETKANIEKKAVSVTAENKTTYVGSDLAALTYIAGDLIEGDSWTGKLLTNADKNAVGKYDIVQGSLTVSDGNNGKNYTINYTKGTYTVSAKEIQTLEFAGITGGKVTKTYGDKAFTEIVTGAETAVTYSSSDTSVATVDEKTGEVTILKAGTTTIKATAEESAVYAAGTAQYILTVNKIKVDVPEAVTGLVYNGKEQTGVELPKDAAYTLTDNAKTDAGDYTAVAGLKDKVNYEWNLDVPASADQNISWSIARAKATVTADNQSMYLGDKVPTFTAQVTGLIGADKIKYSFNTLDPNAQGMYSIVPSGDAIQGSYDVTYVQGVLAVTRKESNAKADPAGPAEVLKKYQAKEEYKGKTLDVEVRTDQEIPEKSKTEITKVVASGKKIQFTETNLFLITKSEGSTSEKNIGDENDTLISVTYKFDFTGKKDIQVFRGHETSDGSLTVDELTEKANANGEYATYDVENGEMTLVCMKFSTFAVAYNEVAVPTTGDRNNVWLYIVLAAIAVLACAGVVVVRKLRKR